MNTEFERYWADYVAFMGDVESGDKAIAMIVWNDAMLFAAKIATDQGDHSIASEIKELMI